MKKVIDTPLSVKFRIGDKTEIAHERIPKLLDCGISLLTLHGRTRKQRYSKKANWDYLYRIWQTVGQHMYHVVLDINKGMNVLDMCAASEMKTSQIVETVDKLEVRANIYT